MANVRRRTATGRARTARVGAKTADTVLLKRAYEQPEAADGYRVLVDRLWPRGVRKEDHSKLDYYDVWMPELAPSVKLVSWALSEPFIPKRGSFQAWEAWIVLSVGLSVVVSPVAVTAIAGPSSGVDCSG